MDTKVFEEYMNDRLYSKKTVQLYSEAIRGHLPSLEILEGEQLYEKCLRIEESMKGCPAFVFNQTRASIRRYFEMKTGKTLAGWKKETQEETSLEGFLKGYRKHLDSFLHVSRSTADARVSVARRFIQWVGLDQDSDDWTCISVNAISCFFDNCSHLTSVASRKTISTHIRCLMDYAGFIGKKTDSSIMKLPLHPRVTTYMKKTKAFDGSEIERLVGFYCKDNERDARNHAIILAFADLGLRTCEASSLTLDSVDWKNGTIRIWSPKTKSERSLPLTVRLGNALENYVLHYRPKSDSRRLFLMTGVNYGKAMGTEAVRRVVRHAIAKTGISGYWAGPHSIRRSFGTELYSADSGLKKVADMMGHDSVTTTSAYVRLDIEGLRKKVACNWPIFGGEHE